MLHERLVIIIIMLPNQAIASTPSAPRPSGAEGKGSTAPLCLQLLRTSHYEHYERLVYLHAFMQTYT
jgi:hypothetical protein